MLSRVRLAGAIFLRGEYSAPWAYESPPIEQLSRVLASNADWLVLFHLIAEGQCFIRLKQGDTVTLSAGDVVVMPFGDQHVAGSGEAVKTVPLATLISPPPWDEFPVVRLGGEGLRTTIVCGYLECDDPMFSLVVRSLPPIFSVRPPAGPAANWISAGIQYALHAAESSGLHLPATGLRLPEMLFQEVLRFYVASQPEGVQGWLGALHDPLVQRAIFELHSDPAHHWSSTELAHRLAYSRSALNDRFVRLLGCAPMTYLGLLRLHLASSLLRDTSDPVAAIALQVGYESEEAFNRAFKRAQGIPPGQWRKRAQQEAPPEEPWQLVGRGRARNHESLFGVMDSRQSHG